MNARRGAVTKIRKHLHALKSSLTRREKEEIYRLRKLASDSMNRPFILSKARGAQSLPASPVALEAARLCRANNWSLPF
jgi:hypothetical protein